MQSFRQRIYPNKAQATRLRSEFGACRFVYNWAVGIRVGEWSLSCKIASGAELGRKLTAKKKEEGFQWLGCASARTLFYALQNVETAYSRFFRKKAGHPKFKRKRNFGGSAKFDATQFKIGDDGLILPKMDGVVKVRWSRALPCPPKFVTISQDACGDFWASFTCDAAPAPLPLVTAEVGIDLGITAFATLSTGEKVRAPDFRRKTQRIRILQRRASRKQKGSANRRKALRRVAIAHRRVADTRKDFQHKLSRRLVDENQVIALEELAVSNMVKNHCLARSISEQGWTEFVTMLEYKAQWAGRTVVRVDRWFPSSKTCSCCGHVSQKMPLNIREWECPKCSATHDRDVNAAKNILAAGRVVSACGVDGRPMAGYRSKAVGREAGIVL